MTRCPTCFRSFPVVAVIVWIRAADGYDDPHIIWVEQVVAACGGGGGLTK